MKTYVKIALFVVSFIALSAILAAIYMYNLKATDMSKAKPDFVVSAMNLQKEFEIDEAVASQKYINKILEITGKIATITKGENNTINFSLVTENELSSVMCTFPTLTDPLIFKPGDEIKLRGRCSGYLMDVQLNNCAVIK